MKKHIVHLGVILLLCIIVSVGLYFVKAQKASEEPVKTGEIASSAEVMDEIHRGNPVLQTIKLEKDLLGISFVFSMEEVNLNETVKLEIRNMDSDVLVYSKETKFSEIKKGAAFKFVFDKPIAITDGTNYSILLTSEAEEGKGLLIMRTDNDTYADGVLTIGHQKIDGDIRIDLYQETGNFFIAYYVKIMIGLSVFLMVAYAVVFMMKLPLHRAFMICSVLLGLPALFIITPYSGYDEIQHFHTAYQYSNVLLGQGFELSEEGEHEMRALDTWKGLSANNPSMNTYYTVDRHFFELDKTREMVKTPMYFVKTLPLIYIPSIFSITLGRILHLGQIPFLYLVRFVNLLVFTFLIGKAIKKIPFGKALMFCAAFVPTIFYQAISMSYDAPLIALVYFYTSYCLYAIYGKEPMTKAEVILMIGSVLVFSPCKLVYTFLGLMMLLIPKERFNTNFKRRNVIIAYVVGLILVNAVVNVPFIIERFTNAGNVSVDTVSEAYLITDIVLKPAFFGKIFFKTLFEGLGVYVASVFTATYMSPISLIYAFLFLVPLVFAALTVEKEEIYLNKKSKGMIMVVCLLIYFSVTAISYSWTPVGYAVIEGNQPRYLLPILPLIFMLFRNTSIVRRKNTDSTIIFTVCGIAASAWVYMLLYNLMLK